MKCEKGVMRGGGEHRGSELACRVQGVMRARRRNGELVTTILVVTKVQ
jgi:hypothetical protein